MQVPKGIELLVQLALQALAHAVELQTLIGAALAAGRDVTDEEIATLCAKAVSAVDALEAQNRLP